MSFRIFVNENYIGHVSTCSYCVNHLISANVLDSKYAYELEKHEIDYIKLPDIEKIETAKVMKMINKERKTNSFETKLLKYNTMLKEKNTILLYWDKLPNELI